MNTESFRELLRQEKESKQREKELRNYIPDADAIATYGYDEHDPKFCRWKVCRFHGFVPNKPEILAEHYAEYQAQIKMGTQVKDITLWSIACEIVDELLYPIKKIIAYWCVKFITVGKILILAPVVALWCIILLFAAFLSSPFRKKKDD